MRSSRSIASRRLKIDAVESVTSLPKHSIKPGRTSPFFWTANSAVMDESLIGLARLDVSTSTDFGDGRQNPGAGCLDVVNNS